MTWPPFLPHFHNPWVLALLALVPLLAWHGLRREDKRRAAIRFPGAEGLRDLKGGWAQRLRRLPMILRLAALTLMIIALARPQSGESFEEVESLGLDIALVLDVSTSMKSMDFRPNRLEAAKRVMEAFIRARPHDRISLVVFAGRSYTQCPPTLDHDVLAGLLRQVDFGRVEDGTAVGTGILNAANRLRGTGSKGKVMILLTDGVNNAGEVTPSTAARAAKALGIRIYTVGVGREGDNPVEIDDPVYGPRVVLARTEIDEAGLREIAALTGGRYYRAQDSKTLESIYRDIDRLEKVEIKASRYTRYRELFAPLAITALVLLLAEILLGRTRFRRAP
ncbi:MAG TPA: VWA domain-containing protein [Fibrobacteria bacterium]|nr:VWA domain-containing protein [Fibrobacteria bacterium]